MNLKQQFKEAGGVPAVANWLNLTPRAIYKWIKANQLPDSEYSGRTKYSETIEIKTQGRVKKKHLLNAGRPNQSLL